MNTYTAEIRVPIEAQDHYTANEALQHLLRAVRREFPIFAVATAEIVTPPADSIVAITEGSDIGSVIEALDMAKGHRVRATINYDPFPERAIEVTGKVKGWMPAGGYRQWQIGGRTVKPHHVKRMEILRKGDR